MNDKFKTQVTNFINSYYENNSISSEEMKKIFNNESASDAELLVEFSDEEISIGEDDFSYLYEILSSLLYFKSIDDDENYSTNLLLLKEFCNHMEDFSLLENYLKLESDIF